MSYRGKKKGSYGNRSKRSVKSVQASRSKRARSIDAALKAPIAKTKEQWIQNPNRFDWPHIDDPRSKAQKKHDTLMYKGKLVGIKISDAEIQSRALGTTRVGSGDTATSLSKYYWEKYKRDYPESKWLQEGSVYAYDRNHRDHLAVKDAKTNKVIYYAAIPPEMKHLTGDSLAKAYAEDRVKKDKEYYLKYGNFADERPIKTKRGWTTEELLLPHQQFLKDVREGKIKEGGLKLSEMQVKGKAPESGYLQEVLGKLGIKKGKTPEAKEYYRTGIVVKITGDDDPKLKDDHNTYGVIIDVLDPYHYKVSQEGSGDKFVIRDTDVKEWVGDLTHDWAGLGADRHKSEIVPLIQKAMRGKIPLIDSEPMSMPGGFVGVARRMAADPQHVRKKLSGLKRLIAKIRKRKNEYSTKKEYEGALGEVKSWLSAYEQVAEEIKHYGRDTVVQMGWKRD